VVPVKQCPVGGIIPFEVERRISEKKNFSCFREMVEEGHEDWPGILY